MKAAQFQLLRPRTLDEALQLLAEPGHESKVLAGGQSLVPLMALRMARPSRVLDIGLIPDLDTISLAADGLTVGARTRWRDIETNGNLESAHPLLREAVHHIAHYQIRNRGTIGGSLAHADPAAEMPAVALACQATIEAHSLRGLRTIDAADFFLGPLTTCLEPDEILTRIRFPAWPSARRWAFEEFTRRKGDFALAGTIVFYDIADDGCCANPCVTVFGVAERPLRLPAVEALLQGRRPDRAVLLAAAAKAPTAFEATSDLHAPASYRRKLAGVLVERALLRAAGHAADDAEETAA